MVIMLPTFAVNINISKCIHLTFTQHMQVNTLEDEGKTEFKMSLEESLKFTYSVRISYVEYAGP